MFNLAGVAMQIEVAYGKPDEQVLLTVTLPAGSSARDAVYASGLLERYPELTMESLELGIFGQRITLEVPVSDGDRIELYRPLSADPKQARRSRAETGLSRSKGKKAWIR